ncbi:PD-(D/E)XK nuclease family transposase, partial [uncultured Fibrella sp.]|uniref:PD-(D/E)XK nuclease family transposase n=1 Tax=uncultured Fibrella sp. TaxID=1284596 RepID=UPI0035CC587B
EKSKNCLLATVRLNRTTPNKPIDELETRYEKWLYVLKNLARLDQIPERLQERIFTKLFQVAELAQFNETDRWAYQDSLKHYRDLKNVTDTATEEGYLEGKAEGLAEGKAEGLAEGLAKANRETALNAIRQGLDNTLISALTGLTESEVDQLRAAY